MVPLDRWLFDGPNGQEMVSIGASPFQVNVGDAMTEAIRPGWASVSRRCILAIEDPGQAPWCGSRRNTACNSSTSMRPKPSRQYLDAKIKTWVEYPRKACLALLQRDEAALVELGLEPGRPS